MKGEKRRRRGQLAVENLMLVSFVMIGVLVSLVLLWYMGIFEPYVGRRGYVGFSEVTIEDWIVGSDKAVISLINEGNAIIDIDPDAINMSVGDIDCDLGMETPKVMYPKDRWFVELDCPGLMRAYEMGDYFTSDLTVVYRNTKSLEVHKSTGKIYGHIEDVDLSWVPPTTTTTTTPDELPICFAKNCTRPGQMDPENCGLIEYVTPCIYCALQPGVDNQYHCNPVGQCGVTCSSDNECDLPNDPSNLCTECVNNTCQEPPDRNQTEDCGPCTYPSRGFGPQCELEDCPYCYDFWYTQNPLDPNDGFYIYSCEDEGDCGKNCTYMGFDNYQDCRILVGVQPNHCPYCAPINDTEGQCEQGNCGQECGPYSNSPIDCDELPGCPWCNETAGKCELGDCGQPCGSADPTKTCELGCDVCLADICVKSSISLTLWAHNGTLGYHLVQRNETIYLNATAKSNAGVNKILLSNSVKVSTMSLTPGAYCKNLSDHINSWFYSNGNPDPESPATEVSLENQFNLTWNRSISCFGDPTCKLDMTTNESEYGQYCYFAKAERLGNPGEWSPVVSDYIQIGWIRVYLVSPRPEVP